MNSKSTLLVLAGIILGGLFFQVLPQVNGDPDFATMASVDSNSRYTVATGQMFGRTDGEILYIWDSENQRLAAYRTTNNALELLHVRNCQYDLRADEFNLTGRRSVPTVEKIKKELQKPKPK